MSTSNLKDTRPFYRLNRATGKFEKVEATKVDAASFTYEARGGKLKIIKKAKS